MNDKKSKQLGMPHGTASGKLRKSIIFNLIKRLEGNYCFQCGSEIKDEIELSIEHKIPYLDSEDPKELFFDLDNIAFSHLSCNSSAARKPFKISGLDDPKFTHGNKGYRRGCKCEVCKTSKKDTNKRNRR